MNGKLNSGNRRVGAEVAGAWPAGGREPPEELGLADRCCHLAAHCGGLDAGPQVHQGGCKTGGVPTLAQRPVATPPPPVTSSSVSLLFNRANPQERWVCGGLNNHHRSAGLLQGPDTGTPIAYPSSPSPMPVPSQLGCGRAGAGR